MILFLIMVKMIKGEIKLKPLRVNTKNCIPIKFLKWKTDEIEDSMK